MRLDNIGIRNDVGHIRKDMSDLVKRRYDSYTKDVQRLDEAYKAELEKVKSGRNLGR